MPRRIIDCQRDPWKRGSSGSSCVSCWSRARGVRFLWLLAVTWVLFCSSASAEVVRWEIEGREPFAGGAEFGTVGPYEVIWGRVHYQIDPTLPQNQAIVDVDLAARNEQGRVAFWSDFYILAPRDMSRGNGALLYDVNNRGNKLALRFMNLASGSNRPLSPDHAGDGFLMRNGFTVVWSGWDGELLPGDDRLRLSPPVARDGDQSITGIVRCEIVPEDRTTRTVINWANHGAYRPTEKGLATATLTHRVRPADERLPIPRDQWTLHVSEVESNSPTQLPKVELEFPAGLQPGHIYELIYEAQDPLVHGTCFASVRDLISALKHGTGQDYPFHPETPRAPATLERAHAFGVSQSGRFLREMLYDGFNQDESGRRVFDGVIPHVSGGGLGSFNHRFAQPTRHATQHDHADYPVDRFPFTYATLQDPLSQQTDGILRKAEQTGTAPLVLHTQSSAEYWTRSGSLVHTDPLGQRDAPLPDNVRIYQFGGTQHGPGGFPPSAGKGQNPENPADYRPFLRALLLALDRWAAGGDPAPPSVYPRIDQKQLVDWRQEGTGFPALPGVRYPQVIRQPQLLELGQRWASDRIIDQQPPIARGDYRVLAARCDRDGNPLGCLLPPEVAVPVATYTGWNLRNSDAGAEHELVSLKGSYLPFPVTEAERTASRDPRRSLEQRYTSLDDYLRRLEAECRRLHQTGYLLEEDIERTLRVQRERVTPLWKQLQSSNQRSGGVEVVSVRRVFDNGEHNAFTDLCRFDDRLYLTFRSCPDGHGVNPTASIIVLASDDGRDWQTVHQFRVPERDTRDPHFLVFQDKLFVYTGTWYCGTTAPKTYDMNEHLGYAAWTADGSQWHSPQMLEGTYGHYIWRAATFQGKAYLCGRRKHAFAKTETREQRDPLVESALLESTDGLVWKPVALFQETFGDETAFLFEPDGSILAVARSGGGHNAQICRSQPPYDDWQRTDLDRYIGGPLLVKWHDRYLVGGRKTMGYTPTTALYWLEGDQLREFAVLPSGGDNSYPGFVVLSDNRALVSYYSSHERDEAGRAITAIYLAELKWE